MATRDNQPQLAVSTAKFSNSYASRLAILKKSAPQASMVELLGHYDPQLASSVQKCAGWMEFSDTKSGPRVIRGYYCNRWKLCAVCAARREFKQRMQWQAKLEQLQAIYPNLHASLMTLTLPPDQCGLKKKLDRILKALTRANNQRRSAISRGSFNIFATLRQATFFVDLTRNPKTGRWNVHVHAICLSDEPLDEAALQKAWHRLTGATDIDIQPITDGTELQVARYCLEAPDLSSAERYSFHRASKGMRLIRRWGPRLPTPDDPDDEPKDAEETSEPFVAVFRPSLGYYERQSPATATAQLQEAASNEVTLCPANPTRDGESPPSESIGPGLQKDVPGEGEAHDSDPV